MAWPSVYGLDVGRFDPRLSQPVRPTFVLLHDAFHAPSHLDELAQALRDAGHTVHVPQLPSASPVTIPDALDADIRAIINCIKPDIDSGSRVAVIAQGYASIPGAAAAERLNRYSLDRPRAGRVVKLILLAGVLLKSGESYVDVVETSWIEFQVRNICEQLLFYANKRSARTCPCAET